MKNFLIIMILFFSTYIPLFYVASDELKKILGYRFVFGVILVTLAGEFVPNMPVYFVATSVIFLCTVRGQIDAISRYILLAAIVPQVSWQIGVGGHFFGTIDSPGIIGLTAMAISRFVGRASPGSTRSWTVEDYLVLTIFLIMTIGDAGFDSFDDALRRWMQQFVWIALPYILFRSAVKNVPDYRMVIACFGVASVFLAVFAIYEARLSSDVFDIISKRLTGLYVKGVDLRGGTARAAATMGGALELGCFITIGLFALACSRDFFKNTLGYYSCLGVAFLGLLATQSRGSLVAVLVSAVVLSLTLRRWGVAAATGAVAVVAWPALQFMATLSPHVASFISGGAGPQPHKYYDYRNLLLESGLRVAASHPLTGMRMTQVLDAMADAVQGQGIVDLVNTYLVILLISGIVGLVPFLILTAASGVRGTVGFKRVNDPALLRARGFTLAAFTAVLVQMAFTSFIDRMPMMFVLTLFGIRLLVQERQTIGSGFVATTARSQAPAVVDQWVYDEGAGRHAPPGGATPWVPQLPVA